MQDSNDSPKNPFDLSGKTAVVTGGTGILGSRFCSGLAAAGARVIIADLSEARCRDLAQDITQKTGVTAQGIALDLSSESSVKQGAKQILDRCGNIDIVVNNAAAKSPGIFAPLDRFQLSDWNTVMNVNVTGMFLIIRELGPAMAKRGSGSIINIGSIYGVVGPDQRIYEGSWYEELGGPINTPLIYSATKGAVIAMTRYLATYWGAQGVRTNTLSPGGVSSGQNSTFSEKYSARVPLGRMAQADEIVGALLFLASDASSYVNGQNIIVDGGLTAW
jgi:NAD(P)-dependent dehydrogenase (short-subunit alcohol dehydrogenase family)